MNTLVRDDTSNQLGAVDAVRADSKTSWKRPVSGGCALFDKTTLDSLMVAYSRGEQGQVSSGKLLENSQALTRSLMGIFPLGQWAVRRLFLSAAQGKWQKIKLHVLL